MFLLALPFPSKHSAWTRNRVLNFGPGHVTKINPIKMQFSHHQKLFQKPQLDGQSPGFSMMWWFDTVKNTSWGEVSREKMSKHNVSSCLAGETVKTLRYQKFIKIATCILQRTILEDHLCLYGRVCQQKCSALQNHWDIWRSHFFWHLRLPFGLLDKVVSNTICSSIGIHPRSLAARPWK